MIKKDIMRWKAYDFWGKYKFLVICFHLDLHELQQNGFLYTNVIGSTCAAVARICYAKVAELSNDA